MHVMERSRSEERIDELSLRVDRGFEVIDRRFERLEAEIREFRADTTRRFEKIDERLEQVNEEFVAVRREMKEGFESQQRLLLQGIVGICASIVAGFGAVAGVLAAVV